jgi:hypothetical protein
MVGGRWGAPRGGISENDWVGSMWGVRGGSYNGGRVRGSGSGSFDMAMTLVSPAL